MPKWLNSSGQRGTVPLPGQAQLLETGGVLADISYTPTVTRVPDEVPYGNH
jgi:hypothetical protein